MLVTAYKRKNFNTMCLKTFFNISLISTIYLNKTKDIKKINVKYLKVQSYVNTVIKYKHKNVIRFVAICC